MAYRNRVKQPVVVVVKRRRVKPPLDLKGLFKTPVAPRKPSVWVTPIDPGAVVHYSQENK